MKYAVMVGNPVDGLEFHGPFDNAEAANEWGDCADFKEVWWVVGLNDPGDLEDFEESDDEILPDTPVTPVISTRSH